MTPFPRRRAEERRAQDLGAIVDRRLSLLRTPTRRDSPTAALTQDSQEQVEAELEKYQQVFTKLKVGVNVVVLYCLRSCLTKKQGNYCISI